MDMYDNDLLIKAGFYHSLGMNLTCLKGIPGVETSFKEPIDKDWERFFGIPQSMDYVLNQDWSEATGLGLILGYNNFRAIDIDDMRSGLSRFFGSDIDYYYPLGDFIEELLSILELPRDYDWVVKSGSGQGLHIIFKAKDIEGFECRSWAFGPEPYDDDHQDFECFELKWRDHLVLSPSQHSSGETYDFVRDFPKTMPQTVEIDSINNFINEYSLRRKRGSYSFRDGNRSGKYIYYKRGKDVGGSYGYTFCDVEENFLWLKECFSPKALVQLGICYFFGKGGAERNRQKAIECFRESKTPEGFYNLAYIMANGLLPTTRNEFEDTLSQCSNLIRKDELEDIRETASRYLKLV